MPGIFDFTNGDVADAGDVNDYLMGQAVPRFASTTTRDAEIPTPAQNQLCAVDSVGAQIYTGSAWVTFVVSNLDTGWVGVTFGTGFTNYGTGYESVAYRKLPNGLVLLKGLIKTTASIAAGATMFTLPSGYRPNGHSMWLCPSSQTSNTTAVGTALAVPVSQMHRVNVTAITGTVTLNYAESTVGAYVSLEGIHFMPAGV